MDTQTRTAGAASTSLARALLEKDDQTGRLKVDAEQAAKLNRDAVKQTGKNARVNLDIADTEILPVVTEPLLDTSVKQPASSGSGALKYVVLAVVVLAGAGAAAWFSGLIPH